MDDRTLAAYATDAPGYADDWESQPAATDLQDAVQHWFRPGRTADIGCGSGRDAEWLRSVRYEVTGYDASEALLGEARRRHPLVPFEVATLPDLAELEPGTFQNVLCETVIMHLPVEEIPRAVAAMWALLKPGGTLYLTWRVTEGDSTRDDRGRLYSHFEPSLVLDSLTGAQIPLDTEGASASSGKVIHRLVARRPAASLDQSSSS
ncbi:MAG: Methyltransferase type 11 [Frondihabitans sp.]|nr:Methyltransferase type 11 [Frondihabitans sp.]